MENPRVEKIKRSLPASIRMDPINARILHRNPTPAIRNGHRKPLALLHRHRRGRQLQKQNTIRTISVRRKSDESPQHVIARLDLLLASTEIYSLGEFTDLVVDQGAPKFVWKGILIRGGDPGDGEVNNVGIEAAIVGEAAGFCGCVESVDGGVTRSWVAREAVARSWNGRVAIQAWESYIAWAGRYGAFVVGGVVAFDAEVDRVGARGRVSGTVDDVDELIEGVGTYPGGGGAAFVDDIARKGITQRKAICGENIARQAQLEDRLEIP